MELIERYLHETGKFLPRKNREDILAEIRSHLEDTLEERCPAAPTEEDVIALLKEVGAPRKMAASYAPQSQYLIGADLYPLFRMVVGIAVAATLGAQVLAYVIALWAGGELNVVEFVSSLVNSVPATLGWVVIVFALLQLKGVQPKLDENWDPKTLPAVETTKEVSRGESIFGIAAGIILLAVLTIMPEKIGFYGTWGQDFYSNPVILQYLPWIYASLGIGIGLNIYLLWQGHWTVAGRAMELSSDVFSIVVVAMLYKGHAAWLEANGSSGVFFSLKDLPLDLSNNLQLFGMKAFAMAFGVTLIVLTVVTISKLVKMILVALRAGRKSSLTA